MTHEDKARLDALRIARRQAIASRDYKEANRLHSQARLIDGGYLPTPSGAGGGSIATKSRRSTTGKHHAH